MALGIGHFHKPVAKPNHRKPIMREVPTPRKRILPDPKALNRNPSTLGKNNNSERILAPAEPRVLEISVELHVKRRSNNAATATAANAIPATVS